MVKVGATPLLVLEGHTDRVWSVAWHPSGCKLASTGGDKQVRIWAQGPASAEGGPDDAEWKCVSVLDDMHSRTIRSCAFSPCGRFLACASFDASVSIWEEQMGEWVPISQLEVPCHGVRVSSMR